MPQIAPITSRLSIAAALAAASLLSATPLAAQTDPASTPAPTPTPTPTPVPGSLGRLGGFSLPSTGQAVTPAPVIVTPTPTPSPTPTPAPTTVTPASQERPQVRQTQRAREATPPTPKAEPAPTPRAEPRREEATPAAPPASEPAPTPTPTPAPATVAEPTPSTASPPAPATVTPAQADTAPPQVADDGASHWWLILLALVAVGGAAFYLGRRGRGQRRLIAPDHAPEAPVASPPPPPAAPLPPPVAPVAPRVEVPRASFQMELRPTRAGLNLLSALVEGELIVRNEGRTPIERIAIAPSLHSAHRDADADLIAFINQPIARPLAAPFTLAPGEERRLRVIAPLARGAIRAMEAGGRPIFVPIVAIAARFIDSGDEFRAARAFAVGVERVDSAKLAPIWLDTPPRMIDTVAARPHPLPAGIF